MARKVTMNQLKAEGFCLDQRQKFYRRFGLETTVTRAKVLRYATVFDWRFGYWLITDKDQREAFNKLREDVRDRRNVAYSNLNNRSRVDRSEKWEQCQVGKITKADYDKWHLDRISADTKQNHYYRDLYRRALAIPFYKGYNGKL